MAGKGGKRGQPAGVTGDQLVKEFAALETETEAEIGARKTREQRTADAAAFDKKPDETTIAAANGHDATQEGQAAASDADPAALHPADAVVHALAARAASEAWFADHHGKMAFPSLSDAFEAGYVQCLRDRPAPAAPLGLLPPLEPLEDVRLETLRGDLAARIMDDCIRRMKNGWTKLENFDQQRIIQRVSEVIGAGIRKSVYMLAHQDFPNVIGTMGKIQFGEKGVLELKFKTTDNIDNVTALAKHGRGAEAVLVLVAPEDYMGAREEQRAMPDQPDLPLEPPQAAAAEPPHDPDTGEVAPTAEAEHTAAAA